MLLIQKSIYASFGLCVGLSGPDFWGREVAGFKLWNDHGEQADQYRTIVYARKTELQNSGWYIHLKFLFSAFLKLDTTSVSSDMYGDSGLVPLSAICESSKDRIYYGCYDSNDT
ncbi:hypothetical protein BGZ79_003480, partial [Entomortierella chlamydospora]